MLWQNVSLPIWVGVYALWQYLPTLFHRSAPNLSEWEDIFCAHNSEQPKDVHLDHSPGPSWAIPKLWCSSGESSLSSIWMHVFVGALKGEINLHLQSSTWGLCDKLNWSLEGDEDPWIAAGLLPTGCGGFPPSTAFGIKVTKWNNVSTDHEIFLETFYTYLGNFNGFFFLPQTRLFLSSLNAPGAVTVLPNFPPFDDDSSPCSVVSYVLECPPSLTQWNLWCFCSFQTAERLNFISSLHLACEVHTLNWKALKLFFDKSTNCMLHEYWRKEEKSSFHAAHLPCRIIKWAGHSVVVKWKSCQSSVATSPSLGNINQKF